MTNAATTTAPTYTYEVKVFASDLYMKRAGEANWKVRVLLSPREDADLLAKLVEAGNGEGLVNLTREEVNTIWVNRMNK